MDKQVCRHCNKTFDFDKGGFGSSFGGHVCSVKCAKASASHSGHDYAIHREDNTISETNSSLLACEDCRKRGK